jgi:SAM-dependent methyltransferase
MSEEKNRCPVCKAPNTIPSVERDDLIVMQNYVYRTYNDAIISPTGKFELRACPACGFAFNAPFDPALINYDENYDNLVPSLVIEDYYEQLAVFLHDRFELQNGLVVEVGCGKGAFLNIICNMYPDIEAVGIDPSYLPSEKAAAPNVRFIADIFNESHIPRKPSLIVCRHVLEHIADPVGFLESIRNAIKAFPETPFFVEVPDTQWIIENNAFWDFCYEHCNYFTSASLKKTLQLAGFQPEEIRKEFHDQYLWSMGMIKEKKPGYSSTDEVTDDLNAYSQRENELMSTVKNKLVSLKKEGNILAIWGMATKGVVFCNLIDPEKTLFDYCIDINKNKFGCFVPHTGHQINSSEVLTKTTAGEKLTIVVMNPNYLSEIADTCARLELAPAFINATGTELAVN